MLSMEIKDKKDIIQNVSNTQFRKEKWVSFFMPKINVSCNKAATQMKRILKNICNTCNEKPSNEVP